jgi:hypothetical protein
MPHAHRVVAPRALVLLCLLSAGLTLADETDRQALLQGVHQIAAPGWPGCLSVYGDQAFAVVVGKAGPAFAPVVAAGRLGKGRLVAFGHNGYFGQEALETGDTRQLMFNAVRWLGGTDAPRVAVQGLPDFVALMHRRGIPAENLAGADWTTKLANYQVLVATVAPAYTAAEARAVADFIRSGGGFLSGDTPWGWLQLNPGKRLTADHGGNQVIAAAGLIWADGGLDRTSQLGFAADTPLPPLVHAGAALTAVEAQAAGRQQLTKDELAQATWSVTQAARSVLPGDTLILPRLRRMEQQHAAEAVPTPDQPLKLDQPLARLALTLQMQEIAQAPPDQVKPHPAAASFPGAVPPDAPRVAASIAVDAAVPAWHSTGLYAAPGEIIAVTIPADAAGKGLRVQIGCHTDGLWGLDTWRRCPEIVRWFDLNQPVTKAANAFGGPVYVDVPEGCKLGQVTAQVQGAVRAPYFVLGRTDPATWRQEVRNYPAPWAELQCGPVILSVPSQTIRALDNPVPLMEFWTQVMDSCAELATIPVSRSRPERYVADTQISAGYMHSGYPIMTHLDGADFATNLELLLTKGSWGHFHEMGHNHQSPDWTFGGTGEVTENLFSLYVSERCCHLADPAHPALKPEDRAQRTRDYLAAGAKFEQWQADPFLALYMYLQLQEAFGWEAYKRVFAEYRALPDAQRPQTDEAKRDQWLTRFSRTVGRNLAPFFQAWGVPTSPAARDSLQDLPTWMPEAFPPPG